MQALKCLWESRVHTFLYLKKPVQERPRSAILSDPLQHLIMNLMIIGQEEVSTDWKKLILMCVG